MIASQNKPFTTKPTTTKTSHTTTRKPMRPNIFTSVHRIQRPRIPNFAPLRRQQSSIHTAGRGMERPRRELILISAHRAGRDTFTASGQFNPDSRRRRITRCAEHPPLEVITVRPGTEPRATHLAVPRPRPDGRTNCWP